MQEVHRCECYFFTNLSLQMEENSPTPGPQAWKFQIAITRPHRLLGYFWGILAFLLMLLFLLPNYTMATLELNGWDAMQLAFKDTEHLRKMLDDSSYLLMVAVPGLYLALGILTAVAAIMVGLEKGEKLAMIATGFATVVFILAIIGAFTIGGNASDMPFFGKLMPKPVYGYHFALVCQGLIALSGILYWILRGQSRQKTL
ncbi:MAG: hypothetical protein IPN95_07225 [Bacteroidetes bacterium]|nr:hypothetical protein [Bacteroidota bacterium]